MVPVQLEHLKDWPGALSCERNSRMHDAMMAYPTKRRVLCVSDIEVQLSDVSSCRRLGRDQNTAAKASTEAIETAMVLPWLLIVIRVAFTGKPSLVWRFSVGTSQVTSACTPCGIS